MGAQGIKLACANGMSPRERSSRPSEMDLESAVEAPASRRRHLLPLCVASSLLLAGLGVHRARARPGGAAAQLARLDGIGSASSRGCMDATNGPVLAGIDVVAYRSIEAGSTAITGNEAINQSWAGYTWLFSSEANREAFVKTPRYYVPQYGGFCSFGVAHEPQWTRKTLGPPVDPDSWLILDDKLYLFEACTAELYFELNITDGKTRADARWHEWFGDHFFEHMAFNTECLNFASGDDDSCSKMSSVMSSYTDDLSDEVKTP